MQQRCSEDPRLGSKVRTQIHCHVYPAVQHNRWVWVNGTMLSKQNSDSQSSVRDSDPQSPFSEFGSHFCLHCLRKLLGITTTRCQFSLRSWSWMWGGECQNRPNQSHFKPPWMGKTAPWPDQNNRGSTPLWLRYKPDWCHEISRPPCYRHSDAKIQPQEWKAPLLSLL